MSTVLTDSEFLTNVKLRLGIFYSDDLKDMEVSGMIETAKTYMLNAGWALPMDGYFAVDAVVLYCKMAQSSDASAMEMNPFWISMLTQARNGGV